MENADLMDDNHNIIIDSPFLAMAQKRTCPASANSFMRQADSNPLAVKCMGMNSPMSNRSMN